VILKNASLVFRPKSSGNIVAFLRSEDDTAVVGIDTQIVMEKAPVLLEDVDRSSKHRPSFTIKGVAVSCSDNIWTGIMNCGV
jgi:hypothetical protein